MTEHQSAIHAVCRARVKESRFRIAVAYFGSAFQVEMGKSPYCWGFVSFRVLPRAVEVGFKNLGLRKLKISKVRILVFKKLKT